jgi:hypothetical protein
MFASDVCLHFAYIFIICFFLICSLIDWLIKDTVSSTKVVGFQVLMVVTMKSTVVWDVLLYSPVQVHWCCRGMHCIHPSRAPLATCFLLVTCMVYSSTVKMEAVCSSQTSLNFYQILLCHFPEDSILHMQKLFVIQLFWMANLEKCQKEWPDILLVTISAVTRAYESHESPQPV